MRLDLNADVGESFGAWSLGDDDRLFRLVTSVNIACGVHAGDPTVIRRTVRAAGAHGLALGAHPSYPDRQGFGRRPMHVPLGELEDLVLFQVAALAGVARAEGFALTHVKPHGALYNAAARDAAIADAIARAVRAVDPHLALVGLAGSELLAAGLRAGLRTVAEAFADRGYQQDGTLVPRGLGGSVIHETEAAAERAIRLARKGLVDAVDGTPIRVDADTLCIHGDTPGAAHIAGVIRHALESAGVTIAAPYRDEY